MGEAMPVKPAAAATAKISMWTATAIVVANMVGTGIFTSLGYQVADITSGFAIITLWLAGALYALCGALSYAELAARLPRSGGEYNFLARIYHPVAGAFAGLTSITVGFGLPVGIAALALGAYTQGALDLGEGSDKFIAGGVVMGVTLAHLWNLTIGSIFQNVFTVLKVVLLLILIGAGLSVASPQAVSFSYEKGAWEQITSNAFAASFFWVIFAYAGWNAATYIVSEIRQPEKNVGRAVIFGTVLVAILYVLVNAAMLRSAPISEMAGESDVAHVAAKYMFGENGGRIMAGLIAFGLISTISAMTWAGPRVMAVMGEDFPLLRFLARKNVNGIPYRAILFQSALALLALFFQFDDLVLFTSVILTLCSFLAVAGLFVLRVRSRGEENPAEGAIFKSPLFPVPQLLFLGGTIYIFVQAATRFPMHYAGIVILVLGGLACLLYFHAEQIKRRTV